MPGKDPNGANQAGTPGRNVVAKQRRGTQGQAKHRAYHHGDLRRALVDAALQLLSESGLAGLTLREAARSAGVSQAAPYRHFADKDALVAAVAERGFRMLADAMRAAADQTDLPLALRFRAQGEAYVRFALGHAALFQLMFSQEHAGRTVYPELEAAAQETFALLVAAIRSGQEAGILNLGDPQALAVGAWCMVHGLAALLINGQFGDAAQAEAAIQAALAALFFGLRRAPDQPPPDPIP